MLLSFFFVWIQVCVPVAKIKIIIEVIWIKSTSACWEQKNREKKWKFSPIFMSAQLLLEANMTASITINHPILTQKFLSHFVKEPNDKIKKRTTTTRKTIYIYDFIEIHFDLAIKDLFVHKCIGQWMCCIRNIFFFFLKMICFFLLLYEFFLSV